MFVTVNVVKYKILNRNDRRVNDRKTRIVSMTPKGKKGNFIHI